jgi:hypothetical protein
MDSAPIPGRRLAIGKGVSAAFLFHGFSASLGARARPCTVYRQMRRPCAGENVRWTTFNSNRENSMKSILVASAMAVLVGLGGCAPRGTPPQLLTFNYGVRTVPDASALIASVQGGQTTISDLLSRDPCNFTADFSRAVPPRVVTNGTPGQTGFNVNIISVDPVGLSTTNPSACTALDEVEINIGGLSEALTLGTQTRRTNGRVWLDGGQRFATSEFFQARVQGFDPANRRSNGDFRFINRLSAGSNTVLIVEGSYALTP